MLTDFAHLASESILIELLADAKDVKTSFSPALATWRNQFKDTRPVDARLAPRGILHDRLIVIDDQDVWVLTQSNDFFLVFQRSTTTSELPTHTERIESPVGDDDVLCRLESDVRERGMRIVVDHALAGLGKVNLSSPLTARALRGRAAVA